MKFIPRKYQTPAIEHILKHPKCAVFMSMGMGKTVTVLSAVDVLSLLGDVKRTLVIAPLRVATGVWPVEVRKWTHTRYMRVSVITGDAEQRKAALRTEVDVYCINYENIQWLVEQCKKGWPFDTVVCDESTRLKSLRSKGGGKRTAALRSVARCTKRWINLTGTPAPNGLVDLWGQLWFLDFGERLGATFTAFANRWFRQNWNGFGYEPMPHSNAEIHAKIEDICLTLKAEDYFDIEDPILTDVKVQLPAKARALYDRFESEMFAELEGHELEAFNAAALTNKCSQLANGAAYIDDKRNWKGVHDAKIEALDSIVTEAAGAPVLVSYWFKSDLARLKKAFPKGRTLDKKQKTVDDWNEGKIPLLFAHPQSAGHGLNLQYGGNILVFFSMTWDLELYDQIIERIGPVRQLQAGFDRAVFIYRILAEDTVDEVMAARLINKRTVQDALLDALKKKGD